ncbi:MAG: hypothetical protein QOE54_1559 [Streptosporangiaceae bacterium]|nr:hypothetical protein [Streptosporangiaceae bacterium]
MSGNPMYTGYVDDDPGPVRPRRWRILGWLSVGLSVVLMGTSLTAYGFYWSLQHNIHHEDTNGLIGADRPKTLNSALHLLMLGTDSRAGANAAYGRSMKNEPPRSDTMILLHLSPGGGQAMGVSFPRDMMVPIPSCARKDGTRTAAVSVGMLNSSFTLGGASCTIKTIEGFTNIKIDHFMQVDFTSFKSITKAVGGVEICLPQAVDDKDSKLHLSKGRHVISGETALAYVRNRHGLGDGSDLQRIKRQQQFMGSLANKVLSAGTLTNPKKLLSLAEAGTKSLTTDKDLDINSMMKIAQGAQSMTAGKLRFVTAPIGAYAPDPNRVALSQPAADQFFGAIRNDKQVTDQPKGSAASKTPPSQVRVRIFNATSTQGLAGRISDRLRAQGFQVIKVGTSSPRKTTQVLYGSGADHPAATLAAVISGTRLVPRANGTAGVVDLIVGSDFTSVKAKPTVIPKLQGEIHANDDICKKP